MITIMGGCWLSALNFRQKITLDLIVYKVVQSRGPHGFHEDTLNVLNMQHITPNLKSGDYLDIWGEVLFLT